MRNAFSTLDKEFFLNNASLEHIKEVLVVEGKDDESAVKRAVSCEVIITHGYGISEQTWRRLEHAYKTVGIIVLTDPDFAGEQIRRRISDRFPNSKHAFIRRKDATDSGDIGVENASPEIILEALSKVKTISQAKEATYGMEDLQRWALIGASNAAEKRAFVGGKIGIGVCSAKQFLSRLNHFEIDRAAVEAAVAAWEQKSERSNERLEDNE